jgi:hypothetical protein
MIDGFFGCVRDIAEGMQSHFQFILRMTCLDTGFLIAIDQRTEAMGLATDHGDHQRKA